MADTPLERYERERERIDAERDRARAAIMRRWARLEAVAWATYRASVKGKP